MEATEGHKAPQFILPANNGANINLKNFRTKSNVILFFYIKDMTSGCIKEARGFNNLLDEFDRINTVALGVSPDDLQSHKEFAARYHLNIPLLSDANLVAASKYGVYVQKGSYRREFMGIDRTTFVIDKAGTIRKKYTVGNVDKHPKEVLEFVKGLASTDT